MPTTSGLLIVGGQVEVCRVQTGGLSGGDLEVPSDKNAELARTTDGARRCVAAIERHAVDAQSLAAAVDQHHARRRSQGQDDLLPRHAQSIELCVRRSARHQAHAASGGTCTVVGIDIDGSRNGVAARDRTEIEVGNLGQGQRLKDDATSLSRLSSRGLLGDGRRRGKRGGNGRQSEIEAHLGSPRIRSIEETPMTHSAFTAIEKSWFAKNLPCLSA